MPFLKLLSPDRSSFHRHLGMVTAIAVVTGISGVASASWMTYTAGQWVYARVFTRENEN